MDGRTIATMLAAGRVAVGTAAFVAPGLVGRQWLGDVADEAGTKIVLRGLGVRDAAIGIGLLAAGDDRERTRNWLEAGIISDAGDFLATSMGRGAGTRAAAAGVMAVAGGATIAGLWARQLLTAEGATA